MTSSFSCHLNYSIYSVNNRDYLTDDFLLVSHFHCKPHRCLRTRIVPSLSPLIPEIFALFSSSLVAGSLWNNVRIHCNCSNKYPHPVLPCNLSWIVLGLDTISSHVLAGCIPNSGPADWPCNWTPHCCTSIWVVFGLNSLSFRVLECYTCNSYLAYWPCN